jgi:hypothetical protein
MRALAGDMAMWNHRFALAEVKATDVNGDAMRLGRKLGPVAAAALSAGLLATACGAASPSAHPPVKTTADILREMESAVKSAKSVHMAGSVISGSQTITFDLSFYGSSDMSGTFSEGSGMISMLLVAGTMYFKANAAFLKLAHVPKSACGTVCGKYVELPSSAARQFTRSLSMSTLSNQAFGSLKGLSEDASTPFSPASYDGQAVLKFSKFGNTLEVARTGTPYPVFLQGRGLHVAFSQWNAVPAPAAPPGSSLYTGQF